MARRKQTDRQQVAEIKRIIRKDANLTGRLTDGKEGYCVIGGLAHYGARIGRKRLLKLGIYEAFDCVSRRFPVLKLRAQRLVAINDRFEDTKKRRVALCKFVDELVN